jgi:hypothetical protein
MVIKVGNFELTDTQHQVLVEIVESVCLRHKLTKADLQNQGEKVYRAILREVHGKVMDYLQNQWSQD